MTTDREIRRQAKAAGILVAWEDFRGKTHDVSIETLRALLGVLGHTPDRPHVSAPTLITARAGEPFSLPLRHSDASRVWLRREGMRRATRMPTAMSGPAVTADAPLEPGYHTLVIGKQEIDFAVAPSKPRDAGTTARDWGLSVQLYSLHQRGDGGIGSYAALRDFARGAGEAGGSAVAVSPVHAQFSADLNRFSPYSPSSRHWMNVLHIDVAEAARFLGLPEPSLSDAAKRAERLDLIDWPMASRERLQALRVLFAVAGRKHRLDGTSPIARSLRSFRRGNGKALMAHATFEALHAHFYGRDPKLWNWQSWPEGFRAPASAAVRRFADAHAEEVDFHIFLQWLAARQFREAGRATAETGMSIGLIKDIAVGVDGGGSEVWSHPGEMLSGASIGAPPDDFNKLGQAWGVTTFSPAGLQSSGYRPFVSLLRSALHGAGGIRIDHILGFRRLWVVPDGMDARAGAYVRYPLADLLRLTALEAHRAGAVILGEDLGTVPGGFRAQLRQSGIRGMQVLWFERQGRHFLEPSRWKPNSVAMTTTHDLPTVVGWWRGNDIAWRRRLGLFRPATAKRAALTERERDRQHLWRAFRRAGLAVGKCPAAGAGHKVLSAAIAYLGRTRCGLALLPLEDALGHLEQPNLPGTVSEHPNWRRRILIDAGKICREKVVAGRLRLLAAARRQK